MGKKLTFFGWIAAVLCLFFYSFTQIDLGLTLTQISIWQVVQKKFQEIGYFNRPLSAGLYLGILILLFAFYFLLLKLAKRNRITLIDFKRLVIATVVILLLAYPAFSYDIYNYIFDAKTIVVYHRNPYQVKPLDFAGDPMLGFMHWTHRPSIFPPLWIGLTLVPFIMGFGKLILQIVNFKLLMTVFYLLTISLIYRIGQKHKSKNLIFHLVFYAFNPLVIIETLVSGHNDTAMAFLGLLTVYFLLEKKTGQSIISWLFSIGIKYSSLILLPLFVVKKEAKVLINLAAGLFFIAVLGVSNFYLGFQPWYLIWVFPFAALLPADSFWLVSLNALSVGALLRYVPFLYWGNWNPPIPKINFYLVGLSFIFGCLFWLVKIYYSPRKSSLVG